MRKLWALAMVAWLSLLSQKTLGEIKYSITDLGTFGGDNSYAGGINNSGEYVGCSESTEHDSNGHLITRALIYDGSIHEIPGLAWGWINANAINDSGQIVGDVNGHAFLYDGKMHDLSPGPGS